MATAAANDTQFVYRFGGGTAEGDAGMKTLLGGKGANLAEMASIGLPVPPGFTISTAMCGVYYDSGEDFPPSLHDEVAAGLKHIETIVGGVGFGSPDNPLLVSVRSGARVSMPGMMDTVLNLGLNDTTVAGLAAVSGDARFAWDSYRRFIQMYADVVLGLDHYLFEEALEILKEDRGVTLDTELSADDLKGLVADYLAKVEAELGHPFPQNPHDQLWGAIGAVFGSWRSERARVYRRINDIPEAWGTAVTVQAMVFGNMGATSAKRRGPARCRWRRRCPWFSPNSRACSTCSKRITATCRTSNSPSSRANCGCSRRGRASAPPRRRSRPPSTWPTKG
jgi:pyruvate,orthophosphate dikinase